MPGTARHEQIIARAKEVLPADPRIAAAWLEGSFVSGTADAWSDVDLHVAVAEDHFAEVVADGPDIIGQLAPVLSSLTFPLGPVRLVAATVEGPVRVDLYVEPVDAVASIARLRPPEVFHGDPGAFNVTDVLVDPAATLAGLVRGYFFGFPTPARLAGRGELGSLILNAVQIVFQFVVPAMLAQSRPGQVFRHVLHSESHLTDDQRRRVRELVEAVGSASAGIGAGEPDWPALRAAHEQVIGALLAELRAACEHHGVAWPEDSETAARAYLGEELGLQL